MTRRDEAQPERRIGLDGYREHSLDRVIELLTGGVGVAGVEAEADLEAGIDVRDPLQSRAKASAPDPLADVVLGVAGVHDHRRGPTSAGFVRET
jgi:hypothetical protein